MNLILPEVFAVDERSNKTKYQQISEPITSKQGNLATFSYNTRYPAHIFEPADGADSVVIVPPKARSLPQNHAYVLEAVVDQPVAATVDASAAGKWLRHPLKQVYADTASYGQGIDAVCASWKGAFSYIEENPEQNIVGLRHPQLGALHAVHAHWAVSDSTATVVMPTGTGKTDTMLAILVTAVCTRLLVVVPTDALRAQIAYKFLTLGVLRAPNAELLKPEAKRPIVCSLEHIPTSPAEIDAIMQRAHVVVTTSAIAGQCAREVQQRFAHHCPYLFIDEAHHAEAPTWISFKEAFKERRIVQFTATPFREDGKPLDGEIIFKYPLKKAQDEGYFKPIKFIEVHAFDLQRADRLIAERAVECLREDYDKGHILMARVENTTRAKEIFKLYEQFTEFKPVQLHTGIASIKAREDARRQIISGESRIVVCVDMLGEGFDLPELKIAAFHDIRKSLAVTLQLAGRFTRTRPDLGDATFIANTADVDVREELQRLYSRDPDWNHLLPELSEQAIGEQTSLQEFVRGFTNLPDSIPLRAIRPASSVVVYRTSCTNWTPQNYRAGIPGIDKCDCIYEATNEEQNTLIVVTAKRVFPKWTDAENLFGMDWELNIAVWWPEQSLLFINGSSNADYSPLALALTSSRAHAIKGQDVFRAFAGINRLRLNNVGMTEQIGRNVRYTSRMGSDVEPRITQAQRGIAQKSVLAGTGYEAGETTSIGASTKGRVWSHQRDRIDQWIAWCRQIGLKLIDATISPDNVLAGTLVPVLINARPEKVPINIDWPKEVFSELEKMWWFRIKGEKFSMSEVSLTLVAPSATGPIRFEVSTETVRAEFELEFTGEGDTATYRFIERGEPTSSISHGQDAALHALTTFFYHEPPVIWFADGSSLEGNQYVELNADYPPYDAAKIAEWDWVGTNIRKESQGRDKVQDSIQRKVINALLEGEYDVIFDDDSSGEAADIVAIRVVGGMGSPSRIEVELYHCKFSKGDLPGGRIDDLYDVCGQAQKSIFWASPEKRTDLFTHLLRREEDRGRKEQPSRIEHGDVELIRTIKQMSRLYPVTVEVFIVQPGLSKAAVSADQLRLLAVTENHLTEMSDVKLKVIAST